MELVSLIKAINASLELTESSSVGFVLGSIVRGWGSFFNDEALLSSKSHWLYYWKKNIFKGRSDLLLVLKEVTAYARQKSSSSQYNSEERSEFIDYICHRIYAHNEFNTDALFYMAFASRFEGLYFGFDYHDHKKVTGLETLRPLNENWYNDSAKYIARIICADLSV